MTGPLTILDEAYRVAWGDLVYIRENLVEVLVTSLVGPVLYLIAFGFGVGGGMAQGSDSYLAFIIPGIIAMTTLSATFNTVSNKVLVQRIYYMSFDELCLCPIHTSAVVLGKCLHGIIRALLSCIVIMVVGHFISPDVVVSPLALAVVFVAGLMFSLFGVLAGLVVTKSQKLSLFSSIIIVPMTFLCGTLFDLSALPDVVAAVVYILPLTHVSEIMRGVMLDTGVPLDSVVIVACFTVLFFTLCWWLIKTHRC